MTGFLAPDECDRLIDAAKDHMTPAPVVGAGNGEVSTSRTSSTCYLAREVTPHIPVRQLNQFTALRGFAPFPGAIPHFSAFKGCPTSSF